MIISQFSKSIRNNFSMLKRPFGLLKLMPNEFGMIKILQWREPYLDAVMQYTFDHGFHLNFMDMTNDFFFQICMMPGATILYIWIPRRALTII